MDAFQEAAPDAARRMTELEALRSFAHAAHREREAARDLNQVLDAVTHARLKKERTEWCEAKNDALDLWLQLFVNGRPAA